MAAASKHKKHKTLPEWLRKARNTWTYTGKVRPPFALAPEKGQRSVWDFPRPPAVEQESREILVRKGDILLAATTKALAVLETASPPTFYIPPSDIHLKNLRTLSQKNSFCEWKGKAVYWALATAPTQTIAWSYPNPLEPYGLLTDYLAFYPQHLECFIEGERVQPQPGPFYAGWITRDLTGPFKGEPGTGHW